LTSTSSISAPSGQPRWRVAIVIAQLAYGLLAMTISLPSLQDWPAIFDASQAAVQLTFSGYVAAYGGLQLVYGPFSDRLGRKPVLIAGLAVALLGSLAAALAPSLAVLTAARVLQGAGCAACMVIGRALVQDLFEGPERTRIMAFVGMTMGLVPPAATLIGGQLHVRLGWQSNFVLLSVLAALLLLAAWRGLPSGRPAAAREGGRSSLLAGYAQLARTPGFGLFALITASTTATFYTFLSGAPIVLAGYGVTPERIGWYIMWPPTAYILGNMLTTRLIHRLGERRMMALGQACTVAGVLIMLSLGLVDLRTPLALSIPLALMGVGHGLLVPPALSGTVGLVPALAGSAAAAAGLMQQLAGALGGWMVGLVPHSGAVNLAVLMLAWALLGVAATALLARAPRRA
jgi:MFS transporter, DHA1 family, multidrug resistance protein